MDTLPHNNPSTTDLSRLELTRRRSTGWLLFCALLSLSFAKPLLALIKFALKSDLYSYIILVPVVSGYLLWLKREGLARPRNSAVLSDVIIPFFGGAASLMAYWVLALRGWTPAASDYLAISIFPFVCFVIAGFLVFFGRHALRRVAFPVGFLFLMVPFPTSFTNAFEAFLQHTSADAASGLFTLSGATVFRDGLQFRLPGIALEVARECSGIHSSLVLLITSFLAGHLLLRSPWKKAALALAIVPLGIARNGFRIFTLGMLCVHVDPNMIDSPLHHRGGPIFFVLSLVPFFALLFLLRKSERTRIRPMPAPTDLPEKNAHRSPVPRPGSHRVL